MAEIKKEVTARVNHLCYWECGHVIAVGQRYVRSSLTPNDPEIGNTRWLHAALHGHSRYDCPDYAGLGGQS